MGTRWCCLLCFQCSSAELRHRGPAGGYLSPHCPALSSLQREKTFSQRHLQEILGDPWILLWSILRLQFEWVSSKRSGPHGWSQHAVKCSTTSVSFKICLAWQMKGFLSKGINITIYDLMCCNLIICYIYVTVWVEQVGIHIHTHCFFFCHGAGEMEHKVFPTCAREAPTRMWLQP